MPSADSPSGANGRKKERSTEARQEGPGPPGPTAVAPGGTSSQPPPPTPRALMDSLYQGKREEGSRWAQAPHVHCWCAVYLPIPPRPLAPRDGHCGARGSGSWGSCWDLARFPQAGSEQGAVGASLCWGGAGLPRGQGRCLCACTSACLCAGHPGSSGNGAGGEGTEPSFLEPGVTAHWRWDSQGGPHRLPLHS